MKRDRDLDQREELDATLITKTISSSSSTTNSKTWVESQDKPDAGMDELLTVLGYKIKSSDMADVAQKLEQLEMVMNTSSSMEDEFSNIFSDTVHYNPSDVSNWVQSMLSELNNNGLNHSTGENESQIFADDLRAITGDAIFGQSSSSNSVITKKLKPSDEFSGEASRPVVLVDPQESGIRLVHTLMACAEAIQAENLKLADTLVKHVGLLAVSQSGSMRKVATYFGEALARKIYKIYPQDLESSYSDVLQMHFYESCPYLKFAHFTANQAILEAFAGADRVHVIDFSLNQGTQWPALMQAVALRPGGPPKFRLTGIGPPQHDNADALQQVGWKLAQLAETIGVQFEFRGFVTNSLADLDASILDIKPSDVETVAINSVFELHRLLAWPGGIEKVLNSIRSMSPKIVTIVEQEANHNASAFLDRFNEALHYYSTMFDSLENSGSTQQGNNNNQDLMMSEMHLGRQICNVVACEGVDRIERHETLTQWRGRMSSAGFEPVRLGSNAFEQASMLLALFAGGDGYKVEENEGSLMLGWHTKPLIATSAWQLSVQETQ